MRNLRTHLFLLASLLLVSNLQAQKEKTLLWKISGNGLSEASYIYGTMHVSDERVFAFNDSVMPVFNRCSQYAMELDPDNINPIEMMGMMMMKETTLTKLLSNEDHILLEQFFKDSLGMPMAMYEQIKPFFTYAIVTQFQMDTNEDEALDMYFHKTAKEQEKKVFGLETLKEQMSAVDRMTLEEQAEMLMEVIRDPQKGNGSGGEMEKMMKYYTRGDLRKLKKLSDKSDMGDDFEAGMITERNQTMVERMAPIMKDGPTFIAVGALHLPGEEGILSLLEAAGYTVTPVAAN